MTRRTGNNYSGARWAFSAKPRRPYVGTAGTKAKAAQFSEAEVRLMLAKGAMTVSNKTRPKLGRVHWRIAEALVRQGVARYVNGPDGRMVELVDA